MPTTSGSVASGGVVYNFDVASVSPDQVTFIDPAVATGYIYSTGLGDPNFESVSIATNVGDGLYDIYTWNGSAYVPFALGVGVGQTVDFGSLGVDKFEVLGIEADAGLSPLDLTAFVTGLAFVSAGSFTGSMTPIVADVPSVPEPATLALMVLPPFATLRVRAKRSARAVA